MAEEKTKQTSGLAIAGLVLGVLAAATSFLPIINNFSFILALVGGILAVIALVGAIRGKNTSKGLAIAGVVLAVVSGAVVLVTQSAYVSALNSASERLTNGATPVSSESGQESGQATDADETVQEERDYSHLALGDSVTFDDDLSVCVNSVTTGLTNYDGSPVVCVSVTYTNGGDKNASFNSFDWKGEDASGVQSAYIYYSDAADELSSGTLSPGGTVTGNLYFDEGVVRLMYYSSMMSSAASAAWDVA